ncbi:MAG TPA: S53 family peptidase [Mycobacteriales bacterium]|nr:S53 family peptidase [Mycobacteriales bacterium]
MSRRRLLALATAGCAVCVPAATVLAGTPAPAHWVATQTRAMHLGGSALGAAPTGQRLRISVVLPVRNKAEMDRMVTELATPGSPRYGRFLTPAEVTAQFGPSATAVGSVERYLAGAGMTAISAESNRLLIDANATVGQAERAFHTQITLARFAGTTVYANTTPALVPSTLGTPVSAVLGLSDVPMQLPRLTQRPAVPGTPAAGSPDLSGFTPQAVQHAYDAAAMKPASGTAIGIVAAGDLTPIIQNLRTAESLEHFPQVPVTVVYGGPKAAVANDNPLTGNLEWDLDTQMSTMVAQAVKRLYIYDVATFTDPEVARAINVFVARDQATNLSASLGECDYIAFLDGAMVTTDQSLEEGAIQGQSMFASTGDNGYACPEGASTGAPGGPPGVSWPSDGEYTTGVGGTTLLADSKGNVSNEIAWIGGGGGVSPWETAPPWTLRANGVGQSWQYTNQGGRSVPDVAADADGNTGVLIYSGSGFTDVGGTSVASPLVMGLWARIQGAHRDTLGLASYNFYRLYNAVNPGTTVNSIVVAYTPAPRPKPVAGFRDITLGTNGFWVAAPGYDYTTGLGALDAAKLARIL